MELEHPRFGKNPQPRTRMQIKDLTAWMEAQTRPFTLMEAFRACSAAATAYRASWSTTYKTALELRDKGLLQRVHPESTPPHLWLHVSQLNGQAKDQRAGRRAASLVQPDTSAAELVDDQAAAARHELDRQASQLRCLVADLLDQQISSLPLPNDQVVKRLTQINRLTTAHTRALDGYAERRPEDEYAPIVWDDLEEHGWTELDPRATDGKIVTPPGGTLLDRTRGWRRDFGRPHQVVSIFFTAPHTIAYSWTGSAWTNADRLRQVLAAPAIDLAAEFRQARAEQAALDAVPFPLTVDQVAERGVAAGWLLTGDASCTDIGVTIWPGLPVPEGLHRPGRSIVLQSPTTDIRVYAWGLPGEPAQGVRNWHGRLRTLDALDDQLDRARTAPQR